MNGARRGSIYVVVLMSALLVVVMALLGLELAGRSVKSGAVVRDSVGANQAAEAGLNYGLTFMQQTNWRKNLATLTPVTLGDTNFTITLTDDFGSIASDSFDPVRMKVVGTRGAARVVLEADAQQAGTAPGQFGDVFYCRGNLTVANAAVTGTGIIRTDGNSSASSSTIQQQVACHNLILGNGSTYQGGTSLLLTSLADIDIATMIASYQRFGAAVSHSAVGGSITKTVICPQISPWSATNRFGVYVIDCNNTALTISNCRIVGTLVLMNSSAGVTISGAIDWHAAMPGYPVLVADGPVTINTSGAALDEASLGVNFNPPGTGVPCNTTKSDSFPSLINGIVLTADRLTLSGTVNFQGVMASSNKGTIGGTVRLTYDSLPSLTPPPGIGTPGTMTLMEGGMRRISD